MKGTGRPRVLGTRESRFDSDRPDFGTKETLGGVTEARRSDMAKAVVRLHSKRFCGLERNSKNTTRKELVMRRGIRLKPIHVPREGSWCNGSTADF